MTEIFGSREIAGDVMSILATRRAIAMPRGGEEPTGQKNFNRSEGRSDMSEHFVKNQCQN